MGLFVCSRMGSRVLSSLTICSEASLAWPLNLVRLARSWLIFWVWRGSVAAIPSSTAATWAV
jgi:hypothetical protein